jgi:hypothetical protein
VDEIPHDAHTGRRSASFGGRRDDDDSARAGAGEKPETPQA